MVATRRRVATTVWAQLAGSSMPHPMVHMGVQVLEQKQVHLVHLMVRERAGVQEAGSTWPAAGVLIRTSSWKSLMTKHILSWGTVGTPKRRIGFVDRDSRREGVPAVSSHSGLLVRHKGSVAWVDFRWRLATRRLTVVSSIGCTVGRASRRGEVQASWRCTVARPNTWRMPMHTTKRSALAVAQLVGGAAMVVAFFAYLVLRPPASTWGGSGAPWLGWGVYAVAFLVLTGGVSLAAAGWNALSSARRRTRPQGD